MRYAASEKAEIIQLVEQSSLPVKRTLEKLGIPKATFYRWYDLYQSGGLEALADRSPRPDRVWNRIPDDVRERIIKRALDEPTLSPRELADQEGRQERRVRCTTTIRKLERGGSCHRRSRRSGQLPVKHR